MSIDAPGGLARFRPRPLLLEDWSVERRVRPPSLLALLRIGPLGLPLVLAFTANALNSQGALGGYVPQPLKVGTVALAVVVIALMVVRRRVQWRWTVPIALVLVYLAVLTTSTLFADAPLQRVFLLGQFLGLTFAVLAYDALRPGRSLGVLFWTGVVHCVLAVIANDEYVWSDGRTRLAGGSQPILLGFEATMVLLIALAIVFQRHGPMISAAFLLLGGFAAWIEVRAYSREDLIAAVVGLVVLVVAVPGRRRWLRVLGIVVVLLAVFLPLGVDGIVSALGANNLQQLSTATGRTDVWQRLFSSGVDFPATGYGYAALNDANGPDVRLYYASAGTPAENAVLQVLLDGGVAGIVVWVLAMIGLLGTVLRARLPVRPIALALIPTFAISIVVSSDLAGEGLPWYWLLGLVAAAMWSRRDVMHRTDGSIPRYDDDADLV